MAGTRAVVQLPEDDEFNPNKYSRYVWTEPTNESFYYCTVDFGLETLDEALMSTTQADPSDPETGGCGGFAWTKLVRAQ